MATSKQVGIYHADVYVESTAAWDSYVIAREQASHAMREAKALQRIAKARLSVARQLSSLATSQYRQASKADGC